MLDSYDFEIRSAFHKKKLFKHHIDSNSLVVDELGLLHGSNRIDIAVINGKMHGYEIKSSKDTLKRLNDQLNSYSETLQKLTFVVAPNHVDSMLKSIPYWCGVIIATKGKRGAIFFKTLRQAKKNPCFDKFSAAHLLWKSEAKNILEKHGYSLKEMNKNRKDLYQLIVSEIDEDQLVLEIKSSFMCRENWRSDEQQTQYGD